MEEAWVPARPRPAEEDRLTAFYATVHPHVAFTDRLEDQLTVLKVSASARQLLRTLYRFARWSLASGNLHEDGAVYVWPKTAKLARLLDVTERQVRRLQDELTARDLIRVSGDGFLLFSCTDLSDRLSTRAHMDAALRVLNPDAYDPAVVALEARVRGVRPWMETHMDRTATLLAAKAAGEAQHAAKQATRLVSKRTTPRKVSTRRTPHQWGAYFRHAIKDGLESIYQPSVTKADLMTFKRLAGEMDDAQLETVITWLCTPAHWREFCRTCKVTAQVPTVGILWGFRATIVPKALTPTHNTAASSEPGDPWG